LEPDLASALNTAGYVLVVVPSKAFIQTLETLAPLTTAPVFWATKGLDVKSGRPLHEQAARLLGARRGLGVLSGPSFAREVAAGLPTAVTVAASEMALARRFAARVHSATFRAYVSTDLVGVELGGAAKNVIAIAAGIADGLGLGANARAGLITRGLAELRRLGKALGARPQTLIGLSGLGDLVLTATDNQSRNRRFGIALGEGATLDRARAVTGGAIEGIPAARAIVHLAEDLGVELPICVQVRAVLDGECSPRTAVEALMARAMTAEH
jgi:glycerol-3-phosphate dehydrogenase (NAD(P)+)